MKSHLFSFSLTSNIGFDHDAHATQINMDIICAWQDADAGYVLALIGSNLIWKTVKIESTDRSDTF